MTLAEAIRAKIEAEAIRAKIEADARKPKPDRAALEATVAVSMAQYRMSSTPDKLAAALDTIRSTPGPHAVVDPQAGTVGTLAPRDDLFGGPYMVRVGAAEHSLAAVLATYPDATVRAARGS